MRRTCTCAAGQPANLTITPTTGSAGVPLSLTGSGFAPNETLLFGYRNTARQHVLRWALPAPMPAAPSPRHVPFPPAPYSSGFVDATGQSSGKVGQCQFLGGPAADHEPCCGAGRQQHGGARIRFRRGRDGRDRLDHSRWGAGAVAGHGDGRQPGEFLPEHGLTFTIPAGAPVGINAVVGRGLDHAGPGPRLCYGAVTQPPRHRLKCNNSDFTISE